VVPEIATERCERDFLTLVFRVTNSNEIRERTSYCAKQWTSQPANRWFIHRSRFANFPARFCVL
jgi:hypothetical protein